MIQEEQIIINNLFEFWTYIGEQTGTLTDAGHYRVVKPEASDWPGRVFKIDTAVAGKKTLADEITAEIIQQKFPNNITFTGSDAVLFEEHLDGFAPRIRQKGMLIRLPGYNKAPASPGLEIAPAQDAAVFAAVASQSFKYLVDPRMVEGCMKDEHKVKLFTGTENGTPCSCGMIFYDSAGNAGLHMIGTLPSHGGKGIATAMTVRLLEECISSGKTVCVLHASKAGEKIYDRLGFTGASEVITYSRM